MGQAEKAGVGQPPLLLVTELELMHSAPELEHHKILCYEYPQWLLSREALVRRVKEKCLEQPAVNRRKICRSSSEAVHRKASRMT